MFAIHDACFDLNVWRRIRFRSNRKDSHKLIPILNSWFPITYNSFHFLHQIIPHHVYILKWSTIFFFVFNVFDFYEYYCSNFIMLLDCEWLLCCIFCPVQFPENVLNQQPHICKPKRLISPANHRKHWQSSLAATAIPPSDLPQIPIRY